MQQQFRCGPRLDEALVGQLVKLAFCLQALGRFNAFKSRANLA